MKKILTLLICSLGVCLTVQGQNGNKPGNPIGGIIVKGGKNPGGGMLVNVGGGLSTPASTTKNNNFLGSGKNFNAGVYLPVYSFGPDNNFTLGPNISGSYLKFNGDIDASPKYKVTGQTSPPTAAKSGNGNASGFTAEAGLHANFSFGKITLSPILNGAYFNFQQDAFKVTQTNQVNGKAQNFDLYSQKETKKRGFAFIPKLRIGYFPGKFGFYLESNYTLGPNITSSQSTLKPSGSGNDKDGSYQLDQLLAGEQVTSERHTPFHNLAVNFGLSYTIHRTAKKMAKKAKAKAVANPNLMDNGMSGETQNATKITNPLYEGSGASGQNPLAESSSLAKPGTPIGGIIVKGGKNPGGQMYTTTSNEKGEIEFKNLAAGNYKFALTTPNDAQRDVRVYTGGRKTEVNSAKPGTPIGGIVVKGGKNPGGQMLTVNSNEKGEIEFKNLEAGDYKFTVTAPTEPKQYESFRKGWDGTVKGGSKTETKVDSPLYQAPNTEHVSPLYKGK